MHTKIFFIFSIFLIGKGFSQEWEIGRLWLENLEKKYLAEKHNDFFVDLEKRYQEALEEKQFEKVDPFKINSRDLSFDFKRKIEKYRKEIKWLNTKTKRQLSSIITYQPHLEVSKIAKTLLEGELEESLEEDFETLKYILSQDLVAEKIRSLLKEFYIKKKILLGKFYSGKKSSERFAQYLDEVGLLGMERRKKLEQLLAENHVNKLEKVLGKMKGALSEQYTMAYLKGLAKGFVKTQNISERRVGFIMKEHFHAKKNIHGSDIFKMKHL